MRFRRPILRHRGAVTAEAAVVYPLLFLLLFGVIVGGMGVFRHQLVASMSREAARYASVRGADWAEENDQPSPTRQQIARDVVEPMAIAMDPDQLEVRVQWINGVTGEVADWDASSKKPTTLKTSTGEYVANKVRVTVTYHWYPEVFLGSRVTLQSVSETPISY